MIDVANRMNEMPMMHRIPNKIWGKYTSNQYFLKCFQVILCYPFRVDFKRIFKKCQEIFLHEGCFFLHERPFFYIKTPYSSYMRVVFSYTTRNVMIMSIVTHETKIHNSLILKNNVISHTLNYFCKTLIAM